MTSTFDGQLAYNHIVELAVKIGPRLCGTPAEKQAVDYVQSVFQSFGLPTTVQPFRMVQDEVLESRLEITEPKLGEIPCMQQLGTPCTPPEGIEGELVFVEGTQEPQVGPHITGKIVVFISTPVGGDRRNLLKYKPLAILSVGSNLGRQPNTFHLVLTKSILPYENVPTLYITYEDAMRLWNEKAQKARITLRSSHEMGESHNVIAEFKGTQFPDEIIVIGGHIDSVPQDPGATDNAAGVATVLELARIFAQRGSKRTLRFAAWGSEEQSGGGGITYVHSLKKKDAEEKKSDQYVKGHSKTELEKHVLFINLDVLGMTLGHNGCHVDGLEEIGNYVKALSCELGVPHEVLYDVYSSDNIGFAMAGIPAVSFAREGTATQYMHTVRDSIELISSEQLASVGSLLDAFITRTAAEGYVFPFKRQVPAAKLDGFKAYGDFEKLILDLLGEEEVK